MQFFAKYIGNLSLRGYNKKVIYEKWKVGGRVKRIKSILPLLILLCAVLVLPVQAETEEPEYGPALTSTLTAQEKYELMEGLYEADITYVAQAIRAGHISCQELTYYYLQRIEKYNAPYNCFITLCDNAMEVARERDAALVAGTAEGELFGVPIVVKDNIHYEGYPTTDGEKWRSDDTYSATIVENLLNEGVIILAKANLSTYANFCEHSTSKVAGETKNAYNTYLSPGGSSGGSAVAVSLNFAMAGLGTDTNSSLRYPAALNGCVTLRSTWGTVSHRGVTTLVYDRDVPGVITRSVMDQALMLDGMTGTTHYAENLNGDALKGAKIGVLQQLSEPISWSASRNASRLDKEVLAAFENAKEELRACGAEVVTVSMSNIFNLKDGVHTTAGKEAYYNAICRFMDKYDLDALIYPTYLSTPMKIGVDENGVNWSEKSQKYTFNCSTISPPTGAPEIEFPIGFHSSGAGIGLSMMAKRGQDQLLLDFAYSYTQQFDKRIPPTGAPNDVQKPKLQVFYEDPDGESGLVTDENGEAFVTVYEAWSDTRQDLPVLSRENYEFLGWSVSKDGSTGLVKPKEVTAQGISPSFADESQTVTLYPQWKKIVTAISVKQLPEKLDYVEGEDLDRTGLILLVQYADGSEATKQEGFFLDGEDLQEEQITIFYNGKTTFFTVSLSPKPVYHIYIIAGGLLLAGGIAVLLIIRKQKNKKAEKT